MKGYKLRPLAYDDFNKGYFEKLCFLAHAPLPSTRKWNQYFETVDWKHAEVWVCEETATGNVVGTLSLVFMSKAIRGIAIAASLQDFVIHEKHRGAGLGKEMLDKAFERCVKKKAYKVVLECERKLITFYEKHAFLYVGESAAHYSMERNFSSQAFDKKRK